MPAIINVKLFSKPNYLGGCRNMSPYICLANLHTDISSNRYYVHWHANNIKFTTNIVISNVIILYYVMRCR